MIELIGFIICIVFVVFGLIMLIYSLSKKDRLLIKKRNNKKCRFSIIIPARDESKVIKGLLDSILSQSINVNPSDVYIVVEDRKDKTCKIAEQYGMNIVLRNDISLNRKGYALDDAIKAINAEHKKYDLYFIFDADNILDKNFIYNMLESYKDGYDIAVGYRNTKNGNDSVIAAASSLTFTMINTMFNRIKRNKNLSITISGTGFYICSDITDKLGGYPFHTLTEDYELSVYAIINNFNSTYNEKAIFYDEQPVKHKITRIQRTRWIRGYLDTRKKYIKILKEKLKIKELNNRGSILSEYVGIKPYLSIVIGATFFLITNVIILIIKIINSLNWISNLLLILCLLVLVYMILLFITMLMLKREKEYFALSKSMKIKVSLYNPIYLAMYIPCAIKALLNPNLGWKKIEHNKNI